MIAGGLERLRDHRRDVFAGTTDIAQSDSRYPQLSEDLLGVLGALARGAPDDLRPQAEAAVLVSDAAAEVAYGSMLVRVALARPERRFAPGGHSRFRSAVDDQRKALDEFDDRATAPQREQVGPLVTGGPVEEVRSLEGVAMGRDDLIPFTERQWSDAVNPHLERLREAEKRLYDGPGEEAGDVRADAQRDARGG